MTFKCYKCGSVNYVDDSEMRRNPGGAYFCSKCGTQNVVSSAGMGPDSEETQIYPMNHGGMPQPPVMPPRAPRDKSGVPVAVWLVIAVSVALLTFGIYYLVNRSSPSDKKVEQVDESLAAEDQEIVIRNFYEDCVFGTPTVKQVEGACTPRMLGKIKESDTRFAMYKFLRGKKRQAAGESRLLDIVSLGDNSFRVSYMDQGVKGSSIVGMKQNEEGDWQIDDVEYAGDAAVEKVSEPQTERETVYSDSYDYSGTVDGYAIKGTLTFTPSGAGYKVKGKYAYLSTLSQYGDKKTSWVNVSGRMDRSGFLTWTESIVGNPDYDSKFQGTISSDFRAIDGGVGSNFDHTLQLRN